MEKLKRNGWKVAFLAGMALVCCHVIFGDVDNWEPNAPPAPTMKSLDEISGQISALSCPIKQIVRGKFRFWGSCMQTDTLQTTIDPAKSLVLLSDAVNNDPSMGGGTDARLARNGACLYSLDSQSITVLCDCVYGNDVWVSYQIIEYK
ncbi:MAG TPA: hypothetical protein VMX13_06840 [Sedimentisphaerales bacterium]|nr:hypothetical protein [Sedimentisphaerales bacterium]